MPFPIDYWAPVTKEFISSFMRVLLDTVATNQEKIIFLKKVYTHYSFIIQLDVFLELLVDIVFWVHWNTGSND